MNIVSILGSSRLDGNSNKALEACIDGIDSKNNSILSFKLGTLKEIKHCTGCDACLKDEKKRCILKDDLMTIINEIRKCDAVIISCPIYYFGFNSLTKSFIDRTFYSSGNEIMKEKKFGLIITYGGDDVYDSGGINAINNFKDISNYVGFELVEIVYGTGLEQGGISKKMEKKCKELGTRISSSLP
jgi:multimeric flavodoxin WrbA